MPQLRQALMAAPPLHHRYLSSSRSLPSPCSPPVLRPSLFITLKPPLNPRKTPTSISFSFISNSLQDDHRNITHFASASASATASDNNDSEHEKRASEAREAITEYLEEFGASRDDALFTSLNCPSYLNMLIDSVDDLDDWDSLAEPKSGGGAVKFKKKVSQMANQKGDKGVLPFLESVGISLSSASHLARYLSSSNSNVLPRLIHQVKYMKDILFSDSDDDERIGKNARRMMAHLSISADDDLQQTLAFFEKIQARRGGLNLLVTESTSFRYLIESFPRLLLPSLEYRAKPIIMFLQEIGVPKGCIRNILLLFPPIFTYDINKDIKPKLWLFQKIGVKDYDLAKMLVKYPWILSTSITENMNKILDFFDEEKVPRVCSSKAIISWPHILGCSVTRLKLMVEELNDMGIKDKKLGRVIATSPQLLLRKPQEFFQVVSFFKDLEMDDGAIARMLGRCPEIFAASIDKTLEKKLQFLTSIGNSRTHIPRVISKYPELFVCDVASALIPRMRYLRKMGLSRKDIGFMVRRFSPLLGYSIDKVLRPKLEFLVNTMERPVSDIVDYPRYFSYSLEKRIKPRYWVVKRRNMDITLKEMLGKNDMEFADDYLLEGEMLSPP